MITIPQAVCVERIIASDCPQISGIFAVPHSANRGRFDAPLIVDSAIFEMGLAEKNTRLFWSDIFSQAAIETEAVAGTIDLEI